MASSNVPPSGGFEKVPLIRAGDLTVIRSIQRTATKPRISSIAGDNWIESKRGILLVARITDTSHKGVLHVYDGGTRLDAVMSTPELGPDYMFPCYVLDMTYREAAAAFMANNTDARHPSKYYQYLIGLECEPTLYPQYFAIREAMEELGLEMGTHPTYGNGARGVVAAVGACERIVQDWAKPNHNWHRGSRMLAEILGLCRRTYTYDGAHNADLVQAISALWSLNADFFESASFQEVFVEKTQKFSVAQWQRKAKDDSEALGGSTSRSVHLARRLGRNYNKARRNKKHMLVIPKVNERGMSPEA